MLGTFWIRTRVWVVDEGLESAGPSDSMAVRRARRGRARDLVQQLVRRRNRLQDPVAYLVPGTVTSLVRLSRGVDADGH
jgi:hypothetical protein